MPFYVIQMIVDDLTNIDSSTELGAYAAREKAYQAAENEWKVYIIDTISINLFEVKQTYLSILQNPNYFLQNYLHKN